MPPKRLIRYNVSLRVYELWSFRQRILISRDHMTTWTPDIWRGRKLLINAKPHRVSTQEDASTYRPTATWSAATVSYVTENPRKAASVQKQAWRTYSAKSWRAATTANAVVQQKPRWIRNVTVTMCENLYFLADKPRLYEWLNVFKFSTYIAVGVSRK